MGAIYQEKASKIRVLQSEKTAFPVLRFLDTGQKPGDVAQGELVGRKAASGTRRHTLAKITAANQYTQAVNALMRLNDTTNDVLESGAITCLQGFYILETQRYLTSGAYAVGDFVTLRYDAGLDGGVFGPVDASATHVIAKVVSPPEDASKGTPMILEVFAQPQKK